MRSGGCRCDRSRAGRGARRRHPGHGGPPRRRGGRAAGRRRVPVLRLRPDQDDGPRRPTLRRGPHWSTDAPARRTVRPDWEPVADRIRRRPPTTGTTRSPSTGWSRGPAPFARGRGRIGAPGTVTVTGPDGERTFAAGRGSCSTPAPTPPHRRSPGWRTRPTGPTARRSRRTQVPACMVVLGGGPSAASSARCSPVRRRRHPDPGPRPAAAPAEPEASRAVSSGSAAGNHRPHRRLGAPGSTTTARSPCTSDGADPVTADCLLVAAGRRTDLAGSGRRVGLTGTRGSSSPTSGCASPTGCGPSGTSPARARSRTCRCTRPRSPQPRSRPGARAGPTTGRCPGDLHRPRGRRGRAHRAAAARGGVTADGHRRPRPRGFIAADRGLIKLVEDADRGVLVGATVVGPGGGEVLVADRGRHPRRGPDRGAGRCSSPTRRSTAACNPRSEPSCESPRRPGTGKRPRCATPAGEPRSSRVTHAATGTTTRPPGRDLASGTPRRGQPLDRDQPTRVGNSWSHIGDLDREPPRPARTAIINQPSRHARSLAHPALASRTGAPAGNLGLMGRQAAQRRSDASIGHCGRDRDPA